MLKKTATSVLMFIFCVGVLVILIRLGFWQLDRAKQKAQYFDALNDSHSFLSTLSDVRDSDCQLPCSVRLTGRFLNEYNLLLDNKIHHKQVGFEVLSLFEEASSSMLVWVNRGWIRSQRHRESLPDIEPVDGYVRLSGFARLSSKNPWLSSMINADERWPFVVLEARNPEINQQISDKIGAPFIEEVVYMSNDSDHGFIRDWSSTVMPPEKHQGYAVQWFSLAGCFVLLIAWFNFKQRKEKYVQFKK